MSFWFDLWMLILLGVGIVIVTRIGQELKLFAIKDTFASKYLFFIVIVGFYLFSGSLFCGFSAAGVNPFGFLGILNDWFFNWVKTELFAEYYADPSVATATSTEFMYSSGMHWLKDAGAAPFNDLAGLIQHPFHLFIGIALFMMYPYFLRWGVRLGQLMFGTRPGKKGFISVLF